METTTTTTSKILNKKVFLHDAGHDNFTRSVDEIMNDVRKKYSDIEINYRKIPYDRQMEEKLRENGKKKTTTII